uniref:Interleukin enhancer-binding factor 2 (inferred by orthology to a human protein) n=1 Tax=Strongyloides venezuelensis TaxID=75913 RepID=A0A0K0F224_STRVS
MENTGNEMHVTGVSRVPVFDEYLIPNLFEKVLNQKDEFYKELTYGIHRLNEAISMSPKQHQSLADLFYTTQTFFNRIIASPELFDGCIVDSMHEIGSYMTNMTIRTNAIADFVIVLKTLPTIESIKRLADECINEVKTKLNIDCTKVMHDFGVDITDGVTCVRLLITTVPYNRYKIKDTIHLKKEAITLTDKYLKNSYWFIQISRQFRNPSLKILVSVIKHIADSYDGFKGLNPHIIHVLCHYCLLQTPSREILPLNHAFLRFFKLIGSGILLPNSISAIDPANEPSSLSCTLTLRQCDDIANRSQQLIRIILNGGISEILSCEPNRNLLKKSVKINGFLINPLPSEYVEER